MKHVLIAAVLTAVLAGSGLAWLVLRTSNVADMDVLRRELRGRDEHLLKVLGGQIGALSRQIALGATAPAPAPTTSRTVVVGSNGTATPRGNGAPASEIAPLFQPLRGTTGSAARQDTCLSKALAGMCAFVTARRSYPQCFEAPVGTWRHALKSSARQGAAHQRFGKRVAAMRAR